MENCKNAVEDVIKFQSQPKGSSPNEDMLVVNIKKEPEECTINEFEEENSMDRDTICEAHFPEVLIKTEESNEDPLEVPPTEESLAKKASFEFVDVASSSYSLGAVIKKEPEDISNDLEAESNGDRDTNYCEPEHSADSIQNEPENGIQPMEVVTIKQECMERSEFEYVDAGPSSNNITSSFFCELCEKKFDSRVHLNIHRNECSGKKPTVIKVPLEEIPTDMETLVKNIDGRKIYCCPICDFMTFVKKCLTRHLVSHTQVKPHVCDVCGTGFTMFYNLSKHKLIHLGVKPFQCTECAFSCNQAGNLKQHIINVHTSDKPFTCTECDFSTATRSNLKSHIRYKHSSLKPFACDRCDFKTSTKSILTAHFKRIHSGEKTLCALFVVIQLRWRRT